VGAAAPVYVAVTEPHRHVIGQLRHLEAFQLPITAVQKHQFFRLIHAGNDISFGATNAVQCPFPIFNLPRQKAATGVSQKWRITIPPILQKSFHATPLNLPPQAVGNPASRRRPAVGHKDADVLPATLP
jgi:hypothetical protein